MKKIWTTLKIVISAALLLYLLSKANLAEGVQNIGKIRPMFLLISIALIVAGQFVRAQRLATLVFGEEGRKKMFWPVLRIQMISFLPGVISPAKVGEATKIFMLQSELDVPTERGLVCFASERVLDLLLLCPLAALGIYVFYRAGLDFHLEAGWKGFLLSAVGVSVAATLFGILFARSRGISFSTIRRAIPHNIVKASGFTVVYWLIVFLEVWCFCKASAFDANVLHMALVVPTSLLSSLLPITFSGFGVREFVMTFLLQRPPVGAGYEQALMVSLMYDIVGLGVPALMGALFWVTRKANGSSKT